MGIIWFVQVVHYPLFFQVGSGEHPDYHQGHMARTALVIAPIMLVEAITGILLLQFLGIFSQPKWFLAGLGALVLIWLSTFLVQVRYHRKLDHGKDTDAIRNLIGSNWWRTLLWSLRPLFIFAAI